MTAHLQAEAIGVRRGPRLVLDQVDLTVEAGQLVSVVGPNGAGKSSLVSALAGSTRLVSGQIRLHGDPLSSLSAIEQARRRAVLPQQHQLGLDFTCREVVRMGRYPWIGTEQGHADEAAVGRAITRCQITELAGRRFSTLSGGERARVAFARVLAQSTPTLLLDEPTAAMDLRFQEFVMTTVREHTRAGGSAVVVIHDLSLAAAYSDRVAVLHEGRVPAYGTVADALTAPLLSRVYGLPVQVTRSGGEVSISPQRN